MKDYLKKFCTDLDILLVYTSNKLTILSCGVNTSNPVIRVHKMFKEITPEIAEAIINYYIDYEHSDNYLKEIKHYVKKKYPSLKFKIKEPSEEFIESLKRKKSKSKLDESDISSVGEMFISQINKKNFWGESSIVEPDESLSVSKDEVMELEILVSPNMR